MDLSIASAQQNLAYVIILFYSCYLDLLKELYVHLTKESLSATGN